MSKQRPLLLVTWKDHAADGSWADVEKFHGPAICHSIGWLWKEDEEGITLAANYGSTDETGNLQYILTSCITERREIKVSIPRKRKSKPSSATVPPATRGKENGDGESRRASPQASNARAG